MNDNAAVNAAVRSWLFNRWTLLAVLLVAFVVAIPVCFMLFENLDANELMVIQSPVEGTLTVYTDSGIKWQGGGKVTKYPRRKTYSFDHKALDPNGNPGPTDTSLRLRFNDGGHGYLYGSSQWVMPLTPAEVIAIHKEFGSPEGVEAA